MAAPKPNPARRSRKAGRAGQRLCGLPRPCMKRLRMERRVGPQNWSLFDPHTEMGWPDATQGVRNGGSTACCGSARGRQDRALCRNIRWRPENGALRCAPAFFSVDQEGMKV